MNLKVRKQLLYGFTLVSVGAIYFALAYAGLTFASINPSASPIWPPTGFALAAVLLWGYRIWPAIFVGAWSVNSITAGTLITSSAVAAGNTLECLVGAYLINRWSQGSRTFDRPLGIAKFALICFFPSTPISATIGVGSLSLAGFAAWDKFFDIWVTWWLGDLAGALVVTPVVVLWARNDPKFVARGALNEVPALYLFAAVVGLTLFSPLIASGAGISGFGFLAVLPLLWAALRAGPRDTATVALVLSCFAVWGTMSGEGMFARTTSNASMLLLITFMISACIPSLVLSAAVMERNQSDAEVRSQQRDLQAMFNQALVGIVQSDSAGRIKSVNQKFCEIVGRPANELLTMRMQDFTDPEDLARDQAKFRRAARSGEGFIAEKRYVRPDESRVWVRNNVSSIVDSEGNFSHFVAVAEDITGRRRAEEELRRAQEELEQKVERRTAALKQSEQRFRLLVDGVANYAIFMLDPAGLVTNWNNGAKRLFRYAQAEIVGRHFRQFYVAEDQRSDEPDHALSQAAAKGKYETETWQLREDGSRFWASIVIQPAFDDDGRVIGFAKIARDITEGRNATRALEEAREQLIQSQKLEAVGRLTGGVAHDFNNLLAVVLSGLTLIERLADSDHRLLSVVQEVRQAVQRGAGLTKQLLAFSRRQPLKPEVIDIAKRIGEMAHLLDRFLGGNVQLKTNFAADLWPIKADSTQFELALINVCLNARDAMPGGGTLTISGANETVRDSTTDETRKLVAISVSDSGLGIPGDVLPKVFEPFFTTKGVGEGSGLGLSQAYGFAKQSDGSIDIASEVGRGTTVTFRLPAVESDQIEAKPERARSAIDRALGGTVLLVEDDRALAAFTKQLFEQAGYNMRVVHSASAAIRDLERDGGIDVVLSDIVMPGSMDGLQLARTVQARFPTVPVLLTTGFSEAAHMAEIAGIRIVTKPFDPNEMMALVATLIAKARREQGG